MRRVVLLVVVALVVLLGSAIGLYVWGQQPRHRPEPVKITFDELPTTHAAITIRGTAHYRGIVNQNVAPSIVGPGGAWYVYALLPVGDTEGREVDLLVRTQQKPPARIDYEFVEVTGWVDAPKPYTVPLRTEELMARADYFFGPDIQVIEPWELKSFDPAE